MFNVRPKVIKACILCSINCARYVMLYFSVIILRCCKLDSTLFRRIFIVSHCMHKCILLSVIWTVFRGWRALFISKKFLDRIGWHLFGVCRSQGIYLCRCQASDVIDSRVLFLGNARGLHWFCCRCSERIIFWWCLNRRLLHWSSLASGRFRAVSSSRVKDSSSRYSTVSSTLTYVLHVNFHV